MKKRIVVAIFLSLLLFCAGCATVNNQVGLQSGVLSDKLKLSEKDILEDAQKLEDFLYKSGAVYEEEPELEAYINEVGKKMAPQELSADNIEFKFKILKDPALNAFAISHGKIYITTGLLTFN